MALAVTNSNPGKLNGVTQITTPTISGVIQATPPLLTNLQNPKAAETHYTGVLGAATTAGDSNSNIDPATAAYYGDMASRLKSYLGSVPTTEQQGEAKINGEFNDNATKLNEGQSQTLRDIAIKKQQAQSDKTRTLEGIDSNVANTVDSFSRLLGLGHAGNSAFARDFVPTATARVGSQQRGQAFDTYGQNARALDLSQEDANKQYQDSTVDLAKQRDNSIYGLKTGVEQQKQDLLDRLSEALYNQQLAQGGGAAEVKSAIAPYTQATNDVISRLASLFSQYQNPTMTVKPINVSVPNLATYTADPLTARLAASNPDTPQQDLPFLPSILKKKTSAVA